MSSCRLRESLCETADQASCLQRSLGLNEDDLSALVTLPPSAASAGDRPAREMPGFDLTAREGDVPLGRRRVDEEERQRVSSEEYLAAHNPELYLREAVKHASRCAAVRDPGGVNPNTHIEAAAEYFQAVNLGRHVAGREWAFVQATERNQLAFLHDCRRAWGSTPTTMSARDWHGALRLQCPDLPFAVVKAAHDAAVGAGEADEGEGEGATGDAAVDFRRLFPALRTAVAYAPFLGGRARRRVRALGPDAAGRGCVPVRGPCRRGEGARDAGRRVFAAGGLAGGRLRGRDSCEQRGRSRGHVR